MSYKSYLHAIYHKGGPDLWMLDLIVTLLSEHVSILAISISSSESSCLKPVETQGLYLGHPTTTTKLTVIISHAVVWSFCSLMLMFS